VLLGDGDGTFTAQTPLAIGGTPTGISAGHYDWDGRLDLAVSDAANDRVLILKGGGSCTIP